MWILATLRNEFVTESYSLCHIDTERSTNRVRYSHVPTLKRLLFYHRLRGEDVDKMNFNYRRKIIFTCCRNGRPLMKFVIDSANANGGGWWKRLSHRRISSWRTRSTILWQRHARYRQPPRPRPRFISCTARCLRCSTRWSAAVSSRRVVYCNESRVADVNPLIRCHSLIRRAVLIDRKETETIR